MEQNKVKIGDDLKEAYGGSNVVVFGGAGFVGSQLVKKLSEAGANRITVIDNFSRGSNIIFGDGISYVIADVNELDQYDYPFDRYDMAFNLTAVVAGVLFNQDNQIFMYNSNLKVLLNPIDTVVNSSIKRYLNVSSVCVYSEENQNPCLEENGFVGHPHDANYGYAMAKRAGELEAAASDIPHVVSVRPSNIIGPYDYYDERAHVVPAFVRRSVETDGIFNAYGSPMIQRELIYSEDVAVGMMYALAFGENREAYNVGCNGDNVVTMLSLANTINWLVSRKMPDKDSDRQVIFDITRGGGDSIRYSNAEKLRSLGWSHEWNVTDALEVVVDDYLDRREKLNG